MSLTTILCVFTTFLVASSYNHVIENGEQPKKEEKNMLLRIKRQGDPGASTSAQPPVETFSPSSNPPIVESTQTQPITTVPPPTGPPPQPPEGPPPTAGPGVPGVSCSPDIYKMYAAKCCLLPPLLDEDMTKKCSVTMRTFSPFALSQVGRGIGNRHSSPFRYQFKQMPPQKNLSGKITVEQICLTDCVFRQYQWISNKNDVDLSSLQQVLSSVIPNEKETYLLLNYAIPNCSSEGVLSKAENATSMLRQRKCYHAPTKLLRCIRRFMLLNCPQVWSPNAYTVPKHCVLDKMMIEKCDVNTL